MAVSGDFDTQLNARQVLRTETRIAATCANLMDLQLLLHYRGIRNGVAQYLAPAFALTAVDYGGGGPISGGGGR